MSDRAWLLVAFLAGALLSPTITILSMIRRGVPLRVILAMLAAEAQAGLSLGAGVPNLPASAAEPLPRNDCARCGKPCLFHEALVLEPMVPSERNVADPTKLRAVCFECWDAVVEDVYALVRKH